MKDDTQQPSFTTENVIRAEFEEINQQRKERLGENVDLSFKEVFGGVKKDAKNSDQPAKPLDFLSGPIGLCFSGGGIRSATFNLGVLQGLREAGFLKFIDYLSTVSGGGYIGSWFTATNYRLAKAAEEAKAAEIEADKLEKDYKHAAAADKEKLKAEWGEAKKLAAELKDRAEVAEKLETDYDYLDENKPAGSPFIHHLRQYSRYMAPKAGITSGDTWTMVSTWLRNTTLIQTMVISCIGFLVCLVAALPLIFRGLVENVAAPKAGPFCQMISAGLWWVAVIAAQIFCIWAIVALCRRGIQCVQDGSRDLKALGNKPGLSGVLLAGLLTVGSFLASVQLYRMHVDGLCVLGIPKKLPGNAAWMDWFRTHFRMDPTVTLMVIVVSLLSVWMAWLSLRPTARQRGRMKTTCFWVFGMLFQFLLGMVLVHGVCSFFGTLIGGSTPLKNASALSWTTIFGPVLIMLGYCTIQVLAIGIIGRHMDEKMREWWGRAGAWVLMGATLILLASLVVIAGPVFVDWLFSDQLKAFLGSSVVIGWVLTLVVGVLAGNSSKTGKSGGGGSTEALAANLPLIFLVGLLLLVSYIVRWKLMPEYNCCCTSGFLIEAYPLDKMGDFLENWSWIGPPLFILGLIFINRLDLNEFSMNPFYRNRLVRCYLGGSRLKDDRHAQPVTAFDFEDDLPISHLTSAKAPHFQGPFQIVNTAINSGASAGLDVQDRSAESFIFTPLHAGFDYWRKALGKKTGKEEKRRVCYHPAKDFTWEKDGWTLGTALSVSGAAASPNSGYHTSPLVAFMLTVFNARLGWWTPHPDGKKGFAKKPQPPGLMGFFWYLMAELTGSATLDSDFVYLSDGGHFENLGLYELVRRRCSVIIVGDGECDPTYNFQALGVAIRRCRVDFGVCIEIETHLIKPDPTTGLSSSHGVVGKIIYPGGREGILIYLKSSVTGDESLDVRQYRGENPLFPHESTGDQFYSESQFESYRCLGKHVALEMLAPSSTIQMAKSLVSDRRTLEKLSRQKDEENHPAPDENHEFSTIIDKLADFWIPPPPVKVSSFVQHTEALISIWRQAAADPALAELDKMLIRGWKKLQPDGTTPPQPPSPAAKGSSTDRRAATYLCLQVIQLMENVFLDLDFVHHADHADNTGWMDIFKDWANHDLMKQVWLESRHTYGTRFRTFWRQQLEQP